VPAVQGAGAHPGPGCRAYAGKITFVKLNTDEAQDLAAEFGIRGIPTLAFMKGGKVINSLVGLRGEGDIKSAVDALL